jgi:hypothetical protein
MNNVKKPSPLHAQLARDLNEDEINKVAGGCGHGGDVIVPDGGLGTIIIGPANLEVDCL